LSPSLSVPAVSFHDAVGRFRAFLRANDRPEVVAWIGPDDVIAVQSSLHVLLRGPDRRWRDAQCRYELGLDRKLGIVLEQVCESQGISCCQVYIPRNARDAEVLAIEAGLKMSVSEETRRARGVTSRLYWAWLKMRGRADPFKLRG
jgi:hypothetical protein